MESEDFLKKGLKNNINFPAEEIVKNFSMGADAKPRENPESKSSGGESPQVKKERDLSKYDLPKNRRNKTMRYGLKEVADVIFFDIGTGRPELIFDSLKVSNLENEAESTEATGGQGNAPLVAWDYGRTATLTMQDALLSDKSMAMLAGNELKDAETAGVNVTRHETAKVGADGAVELKRTPVGKANVYDYTDGSIGEEYHVESKADKILTVHTDSTEATALTEGTEVIVFYETVAPKDSKVVTFSSDSYPATYRVVGTSLVRDEDGQDYPFQFVIPRAKLQSGFTFTMDPENVSTFDFNLQILVEKGTRKLYDIIRLGEEDTEK